MNPLAASSQTWIWDGSASGSPPFPGSAGAAVPSNFFIVIDDISVMLTAVGAGDYYVTVKTDDGQTLFNIGKTFLASESDSFHITFPRGFVLPKLTRSAGGAGGRISVLSNAVYTNAALFTMNGSPATCNVVVNYRYVAPAAVGV